MVFDCGGGEVLGEGGSLLRLGFVLGKMWYICLVLYYTLIYINTFSQYDIVQIYLFIFIYSSIHLFTYSSIHLFTYSSIHLLIQLSSILLFIYSSVHLFIISPIHLFIYSSFYLYLFRRYSYKFLNNPHASEIR